MNQAIVSSSGIRGVVGQTISVDTVIGFARAFATYLGSGPVIIAGDTRQSHDTYRMAAVSAFLELGIDVIDIGKVPTPTCQLNIRRHKAKGGFIITASHNPVQWNGIKVMDDSGAFLSSNSFESFISTYHSKQYLDLATSLGSYRSDPTAIQYHIDQIKMVLDVTPIQKANLKICIDPNHGAGAIATPMLLDALGVEYDTLGGSPDGLFSHEPEPLKENLSELQSKMANSSYDIGFSQDPDADRLVILDENGHFIGEDYSLAFCVDYLLSIDSSTDKKVVVNCSTSQVVQDVAKKHGASTQYTKIGETHVSAQIKASQAVVGGEGNGGVIYPKVGWGRDSLTGIVVALLYLATQKKTVSQIVGDYPNYVLLRHKKVLDNRSEIDETLSRIKEAFKDSEQETLDGVKVWLNQAWIHVRPSNTEPIMRCFIEARSLDEAQRILKTVPFE